MRSSVLDQKKVHSMPCLISINGQKRMTCKKPLRVALVHNNSFPQYTPKLQQISTQGIQS